MVRNIPKNSFYKGEESSFVCVGYLFAAFLLIHLPQIFEKWAIQSGRYMAIILNQNSVV